jgi:hypothetical protein
MIRYRLKCSKKHEFEAWFKSSADYDSQAKRKLVTCPECGTAKVTKALMAPNVSTKKGKSSNEMTVANAPAASQSEQRRQLLGLMRKLRAEVEKNAEYVGPRFAEEARKMHYEEIETRGIYGEATAEEARQLAEDGIDFYPLPTLPEDQN